MDITTIITAIASATGLGLGIGFGTSALRVGQRAQRDLKRYRQQEQTEEPSTVNGELSRPDGRKRDSSIAGLYKNVLRHTNGDYSTMWEVTPQPTMFSHDHIIESRCNSMARMLAVDKPPGTLIQFRYSSGPDTGRAILKHRKSRGNGDLTHLEASRLHESTLEFYQDAAAAERFRQSLLSMWVRVPGKQKGDDAHSGLNAFLPHAFEEIGKHGFKSIPASLRRSWVETADNGVVRRLIRDEFEAKEKAEKVFRQIERECPLNLKRLVRGERDELWEAIYFGHRQDSHSIPILPDTLGLDIRNYLCAETISCEGNYVMHGSHPAAVVSLFTPPQPFVTADALRTLIFNPSLNFRHTIVVEFVYPDQRKAAKKLDRRIRQVRRASKSGDGQVKQTPEAKAAFEDLTIVREQITGSREALLEMRFHALVYAPPVFTHREKAQSLKYLDRACEQVITALRQIPGVEAAREEPESLQVLYPKLLVGEADTRPTGREITEVADSLAALIPSESTWEGARRPHLLCSTPTGRLLGLDLFDRGANPSPLALAVGASGSGKSVIVASISNSVLATLREARVRAIDFGESFGPHVDVVGGRHLRFNVDDPRTINTWDYQGLERGEMPDEIQIALVVMELMLLARVKGDDSIAEDILTNLVTEVYRNEAPRNAYGRSKHEPTLSNLLALLDSYPFENQMVKDRAATLTLALEKYRGHKWIDAPTHPDFTAVSPYDVYELDSLENFPQDIREAMAGRVASRVVRSIGELKEDGTRTPMLLVVDEFWKIRDKYPRILDVIKRGARQGRKENVVTVLATQAYQDFDQIHDLTANAGLKIIGKQIGDYSKLIADAELSDNAVAAITAIRNVVGEYAQFVMVQGSGTDQIIEMIQADLSSQLLWTLTNNTTERNARARVSTLRPEWSVSDVKEVLATLYPRGLVAAGIMEIDESLFTR
jgi:hypothetical protein